MQAPASSILGTGLYAPRLGNAPFDAAATLSTSGRQITKLSDKTIQWQVPGTNITYQVPANFKTTSKTLTQSKYLSFKSSTQATTDIEATASLKAVYMGFSGSASASYALQDAFEANSYIALFAYAFERYSMTLVDDATFPDLFLPHFVAELTTLPQPFDGRNIDVYDSYREFLYRWGTHIVTEVSFGQRFFFNITQSSTEGATYSNFEAAVGAEYDGFDSGLSGSASFKKTDAYKKFLQQATQSVTIAGGDAKYHAKLSADPSDKATFEEWSGDEVAAAQDKPVHLTLKSLDEILRLTPGSKFEAYANDIQNAIGYLLNVRETVTDTTMLNHSRLSMFVKVKAGATAPGNCSLILSDDGEAKITPVKNQGDGWGPSVNTSGFEYGQYGRSVRFSDDAYNVSNNSNGWDSGHLTRFNLTYGATTTLTFSADENIEYVIFASGRGSLVGGWSPDTRRTSRHVYWNPNTDPSPLQLTAVDLGRGAEYRSKSWPGPRNQFQIWEEFYGPGSH